MTYFVVQVTINKDTYIHNETFVVFEKTINYISNESW